TSDIVGAARKKEKAKDKTGVAKVVEEPQPPLSAVSAALTQALGRKLDLAEVDYVNRIQWIYNQMRLGSAMTTELLHQLAPAVQDYSWTQLTLWPQLPKDDLQFWLYCAWEIRRRGFA